MTPDAAKIAAYEESLKYFYEETDRLRGVAKVSVLVAIVMFIVFGAAIWVGIGRCG
jgi:uncharacterized BrkB/YihY/UPF0761 family membrane protein